MLMLIVLRERYLHWGLLQTTREMADEQIERIVRVLGSIVEENLREIGGDEVEEEPPAHDPRVLAAASHL